MKAVRITQWGQPYQIEEIPQPQPSADEILIKVRAASFNPVDSFVAAGYLQSLLVVPMTPGTDFAGEVAAVGANVTHVKPGDAVYGLQPMRGGTFAEYSVAKASEVALKPASISDAEASAVPLTALAAWQTLDLAHLKSGQRVLILGAGGGVGSFAVQLAKDKGAYVIALDMAGKADTVRNLGADEFFDASSVDFAALGKVDAVADFVGSEDLRLRSCDALKPGGHYVTTLTALPEEEATSRGIQASTVFAQASVDQLTQIAQLIDAGKLKITVSDTFPLDQAQAALELRQSGKAAGKVVLLVG